MSLNQDSPIFKEQITKETRISKWTTWVQPAQKMLIGHQEWEESVSGARKSQDEKNVINNLKNRWLSLACTR